MLKPMTRNAIALALLAGTLISVGCYTPGGRFASRDQFTYVSTPLQPQTITLFDARTNEEIWSKDVPVGAKLVVRFLDKRGSGEGSYPALMRWELIDPERISGALKNELAVPDRESRRLEVTLRDAPEYPEDSLEGTGAMGVSPAFTLPPSEPIFQTASSQNDSQAVPTEEIRFDENGVPMLSPMRVSTGDMLASVMSQKSEIIAPTLRGKTVPIVLLTEQAAKAATAAAIQADRAGQIASRLETLLSALASGAAQTTPFEEPYGMDSPARDLPTPPGAGSIDDVAAEPEFFDRFGLFPELAAPIQPGITLEQAGPSDPADLPLPEGTSPSSLEISPAQPLDADRLLED